MKLEKIKIEGLRKIKCADIVLGDTSFLIGENNVGKSTVFEAVRLLLTNSAVTNDDFTQKFCDKTKQNIKDVETLILTGEFIELPEESKEWVGFRGRVFEKNDQLCVKYRKTFSCAGRPKIEMYQKNKGLKPEVLDGKKVTIDKLKSVGVSEERISKTFGDVSSNQNLSTQKYLSKLETIHEAWNFTDEFEWIENPGGIPQNVMSKLPKFIYIPAEHKADEINQKQTSALGEVMTTIFEDVVEGSENFNKVKEYFGELEKEIDTENADTEFGKLMEQVNTTIKGVFPESQIFAKVNLSDPNSFLKPQYDIKLGSNILTDVEYQGTGMIRATAFSLLKFRENWKATRDKELRSLIVCFEEPEIFLHPNASHQMRDTIYELGSTNNQIVCSTHSPYMIDLSREKSNQVLNNISILDDDTVKCNAFNVTKKFKDLKDDDRSYVKMLLKIDDYISKVFFCKRVVIVEGDTEEVVLRKSIELLEKETRDKVYYDNQIIKARGKATIPPLVKYLQALGIVNIFVMHDRDSGKPKAEEVNPRILASLNNDRSKRIMLEENIEDTLSYNAPSRDKPYKAFSVVENWNSIDDMPTKWREVLSNVLCISL